MDKLEFKTELFFQCTLITSSIYNVKIMHAQQIFVLDFKIATRKAVNQTNGLMSEASGWAGRAAGELQVFVRW